jgi:3,4-dihydroxy 2-butanone 4-phosphate synthase/GTP cyclohydrolase II
LVRQVSEREVRLPPGQSLWRARVYESLAPHGRREMLALTLGQIDGSPTLVRVQMGSILGDVFGANHETRIMAADALRRIEAEGKGVVLYLPERGQIAQDLEYFAEGEKRRRDPFPTQEVVLREIGFGSQVLTDLGVRKMRILTNRPSRIAAVDGYGLEVVEQVLLATSDAARAENGALPTTH